MKIIEIILKSYLIIFLSFLLPGCTWFHNYGPYKGKILELETGAPIDGAVVFLSFYTSFQLSPGGPVSKYADSVEIVTDSNGEFRIPTQNVNAFRVFHGWEKNCNVIIFKPGYGAFPSSKKSTPKFYPSYSIPEDQLIVIWLPKLTSIEERKENVSKIMSTDAPLYKCKILKKLEEFEINFVHSNK